MNRPDLATLSQARLFYGWLIVPIATLASICTLPGQSVCIGAFNESIRGDLGLSSGAFSGAYAAGTILAALLLPVVGALMDRFGIRSAMIGVVVLLTASCLVMASTGGIVSLLVAFFLLRLFGQGSLSLLANNTLAMWFHRHLGKVAGTCSVIVTVCFAFSPLVVRELITRFDWRTTYCVLGVGVLVVMLPLLLTVFRNRPEDVGQIQDGKLAGFDSDSAISSDSIIPNVSQQVDLTLRQALSHRSYAILLLVMTSWALIGTALIFEVQAFSADRGATRFAPEVASFIFFICAAAMQFVGGILADRFLPRRLMQLAVTGMLTSIVMLSIGSGDVFFVAYGLFGLSQGLLVAVSATIWVRYYGRTHLGKIKGGSMMAMVGGSSGGPLLMGIAHDHTGSFFLPLIFFAALAVTSFVASLFLVSPQQVRLR